MSKNKTLLIFSPTIEDGGVEKNLYNISNYLSKKHKKICLLTANKDKLKNFNKEIRFISPKKNKWNKSSRLTKTLLCIYLFFKKFKGIKKEIIILSFNSNIFAIILAKFLRCVVIIRSNTSPHAYAGNFIKKKIFQVIFSFSNEIIVNSNEFKKQIKSKFKLNSHCIFNPVENLRYLKKKAYKKIYFNFFNNKNLKMISIGRLVKQKNHILILKAIKDLPKNINYKLLIIGDGEEKINLLNFIKENKLNRVKILPFKKNPFPYLKKADLFILSSLYEGLPNVLLEAMSLKKFVISSNCPTGPREILQNGKLGELFKNNDLNDLQKKIIDFHRSPKKNKSKILLSQKSLKRFDFNKRCDEYYKIILKYIKK